MLAVVALISQPGCRPANSFQVVYLTQDAMQKINRQSPYQSSAFNDQGIDFQVTLAPLGALDQYVLEVYGDFPDDASNGSILSLGASRLEAMDSSETTTHLTLTEGRKLEEISNGRRSIMADYRLHPSLEPSKHIRVQLRIEVKRRNNENSTVYVELAPIRLNFGSPII